MRREIKAILVLLQKGNEHGEQGQHEEARQLFTEAYSACKRLGLRSPQVLWSLAASSDYLGDCERALTMIRELLALDPLSLQGRHSLDIIARRARAVLADPRRDLDATDTPRLYELLLDLDEADAGTHLAMARHFAFAGRLPRALELLEAIVVLAPSEEAWQELATTASRAGRQDLLLRAAAALLSMERGSAAPRLLLDGVKVADA